MGDIILGFIVLVVIFGIIGAIKDRLDTREWRPFIGIFLIAGMIAVLGLVVQLIFPGSADIFLLVAKWVAVAGAFAMCIKIIVVIAKAFFTSGRS